MVNINEKIKNIGEYFLGMNVAEGFIYITVKFPDGWKVSNRLEEKYDVKAIRTENEMGYYFFTSMDVGFEKIFEAIEDTISFNEVALLKQQLFMEKIKELQILFEDEPLEVLETIEFKYKKRKNGKKNENKEKEVETCQEEC
jgi:hypothetical protein